MNCQEVNNNILLYVNKELPVKEQQRIEEHLSDCPYCRKECAAFIKTQDLIERGFQKISNQKAPPWVEVELEHRIAILKANECSYFYRLLSGIKSKSLWHPIWKPFAYGLLIIVIAVTSLLFVPRLFGPSSFTLAKQIVSDNLEIAALVQGTPIAGDIKITNGESYLLLEGPNGKHILACIDLSKAEITRIIWFGTQEVVEDKEIFISIAETDSRVAEIKNNGFVVSKVTMIPISLRLDLIDDDPRVLIDTVLVEIIFENGAWTYSVRVDPNEKEVTEFTRLPLSRLVYPWFHIYPPHDIDTMLKIVNTSALVKSLLSVGAEIISAVAGGLGMENEGLLILELGNDLWEVRVDLTKKLVTSMEVVPAIVWEKEYYYNIK